MYDRNILTPSQGQKVQQFQLMNRMECHWYSITQLYIRQYQERQVSREETFNSVQSGRNHSLPFVTPHKICER